MTEEIYTTGYLQNVMHGVLVCDNIYTKEDIAACDKWMFLHDEHTRTLTWLVMHMQLHHGIRKR